MFLFNLSLFEFLTLLSAVSAFVVTLYLLSRARRKQMVPTLLFWQQAQRSVSKKQHRRVQQPLSLILQLLGCLLLLLAIAQLRIGSLDTSARDHVLVLDTSSWMAAKSPRAASLMEEAKAKARAYVRALPNTDRVMVLRGDSFASPVTGMEAKREPVLAAIDATRPGASALNITEVMSFASQVLRLRSQNPGEIVFVGAGRTAEAALPPSGVKNLRVIRLASSGENVGLTRIGLRRDPSDVELWQCFVSVRNHGTTPARIPVALHFGGAPVASRLIPADAAKAAEAVIPFRTRAGGWLEVRILSADALAEDNRAFVEIPPLEQLKVNVYSDDPSLLGPALKALPFVKATFHPIAAYAKGSADGAVILDRFAPSERPAGASLWIDPPSDRSPIRVRSTATGTPIVRWNATHEITAGLNTRKLDLPAAKLLSLQPDDVPIASSEQGPVIAARPASRMVVFGFNPGAAELRNELATALLMANSLRWLSPNLFQANELYTAPVGGVNISLTAAAAPESIKVLGENRELPFTLSGKTLRFFSAQPDVVRVRTPEGEQVHSLSLPDVQSELWSPPANAATGVPSGVAMALQRDVWQWLAIAGIVVLLLEWILYGAPATLVQRAAVPPVEPPLRRAS